MSLTHPLAGVYAAAITPLQDDGSIAYHDYPAFLSFLARRGCHGVLLMGTTGEGPSFSFRERLLAWRESLSVRQDYPEFRLLAGTGTSSLEETIALTKAAFEIGMDGVVVLPPYYFKQVSDDGLFLWFSQVIHQAVPGDGLLFGYHIPPITGVGFSFDLLGRLKDAFPLQFAGIKDSSADPEHARRLGERFGDNLIVFNGNDALFEHALHYSASGCITLMANICSPLSRQVWDAQIEGEDSLETQQKLTAIRQVLDRYPPAPSLLKFMLSSLFRFPRWAVRPPLTPLSQETEQSVLAELLAVFEFLGLTEES